jgi:hypothetical protein
MDWSVPEPIGSRDEKVAGVTAVRMDGCGKAEEEEERRVRRFLSGVGSELDVRRGACLARLVAGKRSGPRVLDQSLPLIWAKSTGAPLSCERPVVALA